jgi:hypothetical protein
MRKDASLDAEKLKNCKELSHKPFDEEHKRISGKTHASVRYFAKRYKELTAYEIIEKLKVSYPLLTRYFMPEVRKINDIAMRERSTKDSNSKYKDTGMSADAINNGSEKNI